MAVVRRAVVRGTLVENIVLADDDYPAPDGCTIHLDDGTASIGGTFVDGVFYDPSPSAPGIPLYGEWLPVDASVTGPGFSGAWGTYKVVRTPVGDIVFIQAEFIYLTTSDGNTAAVGGLPFDSDVFNAVLTCSSIAGGLTPYVVAGSPIISFSVAGDINTLATNVDLSEASCRIEGFYWRAQE